MVLDVVPSYFGLAPSLQETHTHNYDGYPTENNQHNQKAIRNYVNRFRHELIGANLDGFFS